MKYLMFIILFIFTAQVMAYDAKIKNQYGRVTGYVKTDKNKVEIKNKYGRTQSTIHKDGKIKNQYGRTKGYISK